jgi:DNA-binding response OmpR family regulator
VARPRILVLDDHDGTLQAIAGTLRREFSVWVARDIAQATAVAAELDWDADLLVVDLFLGDGPRGDEFAASYRQRQRRETPVLVISGAAEDVELDPGAAIVGVVHKPFDFERLAQLVWLVLRAKRSTSATLARPA